MVSTKKYLVGLALPLAFAIPANGQNFELQKLNVKSLESIFSSQDAPKIPEVTKGEPSYMIIDQSPKKGTYKLPSLCPNNIRDAGPFGVNYRGFRQRWGLVDLSVISIPQNAPMFDSGTFSIRTSTNASHPDVNQLNKYSFETTNNERSITRKYSLTIDRRDMGNCIDLTVSYEEERKALQPTNNYPGNFGTYLPHN